ncbi:MAG: GerAB/ArcD/ProY family transporter [Oscillospiraceae bacterium]
MIGKFRISSTQLLVMMFISNIFFTMMHSPKIEEGVDSISFILCQFIAIPFIFLSLAPYCIMNKTQKGNNIISCSSLLSKNWGKLVGFMYWIYMLQILINTISNFEFFLSTAVYPHSDSASFIIIMLLVCMYACILGIEPIARLSGFVIIITVLSLIIIFFPLTSETKLFHLYPSKIVTINNLVNTTYVSIVSNVDFVLLFIMNDIIKGDITKSFKKYVPLVGSYYVLIAFFSSVTLGPYNKTVLFPLYSLSEISQISIFERMDSIHMMIWVAVAFAKGSLFLYCSCKALLQFTHINMKSAVIINTCIAVVFCLMISNSINALTTLSSFVLTGIPFLTFIIIIPIITLIGIKIKSRRKVA